MKISLLSILLVFSAGAFAQCGGDDKCGAEQTADEKFLAEANRMMIAAEGKQACCRTTAEKKVVKGDPGCCNAKGEPAKFKVFVAGEGYRFFGCADSAAKGRSELRAKSLKVGPVQKVLGA